MAFIENSDLKWIKRKEKKSVYTSWTTDVVKNDARRINYINNFFR